MQCLRVELTTPSGCQLASTSGSKVSVGLRMSMSWVLYIYIYSQYICQYKIRLTVSSTCYSGRMLMFKEDV